MSWNIIKATEDLVRELSELAERPNTEAKYLEFMCTIAGALQEAHDHGAGKSILKDMSELN